MRAGFLLCSIVASGSLAASSFAGHTLSQSQPSEVLPPASQASAAETFTILSADLGITTGALKPAAAPGSPSLVIITPQGGGQEVTIAAPLALIKSPFFTPEPTWGKAIGSLNIDRFEPAGRPGITSTRILPPPPPAPAPMRRPVYQATLRDGSSIRGELTTPAASADQPARSDLAIASSTLGLTPLSLEDLLAIDVIHTASTSRDEPISWPTNAAALTEPAPAADQVALLNGDLLEGIIERLTIRGSTSPGDAVVLGSISGKDPSRDVLMTTIKRLRLATAPSRDRLAQVWLSSGESLTAKSITVDASRLELQGTIRPRLLLPLEAIDAVVLRDLSVAAATKEATSNAADRGGLIPASRIVTGDGVRVLQGAAVAGAEDIVMQAPMRAELALLAFSRSWKSARLVGFAVLDEASRTLGTVKVDITLESKQGSGPWSSSPVASFTLTGTSSTQPLNLDLAPHLAAPMPAEITDQRIVITADPTDDGPIQDRIVLRRLFILGQ